MSEKMLVDPQAVKRMVEDEGMTLGTALIFAAVPVPDEITTLRQQLAEAREENEQVRQANLHTMDVFEDMKAAKGKAEVRVAELESFAVKNMAGLIAFARESGVDVEEQNSEYMRVVAQRRRQQADEAERAGGEHG